MGIEEPYGWSWWAIKPSVFVRYIVSRCATPRASLLMNEVLPPRRYREPTDSVYHIPCWYIIEQEWLYTLEPLVSLS